MPLMVLEMYVGTHPNNSAYVRRLLGTMERTQPDHGIGIDLQNAREKTATGSLTNTKTSSI
jgi:hypothetical protein